MKHFKYNEPPREFSSLLTYSVIEDEIDETHELARRTYDKVARCQRDENRRQS
jgi:hypothetical protein